MDILVMAGIGAVAGGLIGALFGNAGIGALVGAAIGVFGALKRQS